MASIVFKLLRKKGIINVGAKTITVYNFAKKHNLNIKKIFAKKIFGKLYPINQDMNVSKLNKILK